MENAEMIGKIIITRGERAIVELYKKNSKELSGEKLDALNPLKAKPGYIVKLKWHEISAQRDKIMLFLPAVLSIAAGAIMGYHMAGRLNLSIERCFGFSIGAWFSLGLFASFRYWKYYYGRGRQPKITSVIQ